MPQKAVSLALAGLAAAGVAIAARDSSADFARVRVSVSSSCPTDGDAVGSLTPLKLPKLWLNGHPKHSKKTVSLHARDRIRTANNGSFKICLAEKETLCSAIPGTRLKVLPSDGTLLSLNAGRASCSTASGFTKKLKAGKATLTVGDPVFNVSVTRRRTIVKVLLGAVEVSGNNGQADPVVVGSGMQTRVPSGEAAAQPTTIALAPAEKTKLDKLAVQLPKPGLTKPDSDDSDALKAIVARDALLVDLDRDAFGDPLVARFTLDLLSSLANAWGVAVKRQTTSTSGAAADLAKGSADVFVTADPADVTTAGRKLRLGDAAGVAAVPFLALGKTVVQLATRADAGLAVALRRYLATSLLQSNIYAKAYDGAFGGLPQYARLGDLAFPTVGHATGSKTEVHQGFVAMENGQLAQGLKVSRTTKGTCSRASSATSRADAWICTDTAQRTWDPCFSGIQNIVVCPSDPPATERPVKVVKLFLLKPLPAIHRQKADPLAGPARRIETNGRTICEPTTGAKPSFGSQPIDYACVKGAKVTGFFLAGRPYRGDAPWTMLTVPPNWQTTPTVADTVGIAAIWYW